LRGLLTHKKTRAETGLLLRSLPIGNRPVYAVCREYGTGCTDEKKMTKMGCSLNVRLMTQLLRTDRMSGFTLKKVAFYNERTNLKRPFGVVLKKSCKLIAVKFAWSEEKIYFYAH
ncbi:MAG: hypothetical protein LBG18_02180, partial [Mediterranea sp.]|nr:hypothetical protein [Mediterranea sp.]